MSSANQNTILILICGRQFLSHLSHMLNIRERHYRGIYHLFYYDLDIVQVLLGVQNLKKFKID